MESGAIRIWKRVGETPLQALEAYRSAQGISPDTPMTYAGRLDPMAEGELLILIGEECKKRASYTELPKTYEFRILLDVESDTGDILGLVTSTERPAEINVDHANKEILSFVGKHRFQYPSFSSKTVQGKPLHQWALEDRLDEIEIPERDSVIYSMELLEVTELSTKQLSQCVVEKLSLFNPDPLGHQGLGGDFRKPAVLESWENIFKKNEHRIWHILHCRTKVSSGTYIRTLSPKIAERLGTKGLALSITRTSIDFT